MQLVNLVLFCMFAPTFDCFHHSHQEFHLRSLFDLVYEFMEGQGDLFLSLEEYLPLSAQEALYDLVDVLDNEANSNETRPICNICKALLSLGKAVAAINEWEDVRDNVAQACHMIISNVSTDYVRTDVLCPGVTDLQGPHIFEILKPKYRKSAGEICYFMNGCLLPKEEEPVRIPLLKVNDNSKAPRNDPTATSLEERKQVALKVVQFADVHIEPDYAEGSSTDCGLYVCCDTQYGTGPAGLYGDYNCNTPQRMVELFLQKAAELEPNFVLYSGDTPPHTFWDESYHSQLDISAILVDAFQRILPSKKIYPNLGNHEMYPTNLYSMVYLENYTVPMNEEYLEMWSPLVNFSAESEQTMSQGGYYTELIRPGLRVLSFNTNYWYAFNWYNVLHEDTEEVQLMIDFMRETFQLAKDNAEKVIVMGHHPPGIADTIVLYSRRFEELLTDYSDVIVLHVAGHTHSDEFRVHSDVSGVPLSTVFVCPSVTAKTDKNPSMRIYYLDDVTYELLDFEQYGFMLDELEGTKAPNITFLYSAMEDYGLQDMSAASWRDLTKRMATDEKVFDIYFDHFTTGYTNATCDAECRHGHVCMSQHYSYDDIIYCESD